MAINPIQLNLNSQQPLFKEKKVVKPYLEAQGAIDTTDNVHPLPPQGHLIHDNLGNGVKYFFKDYAYDLKSVKNGIKGTANDHQSGRLNDVGLSLAGILIATYLASKTSNPKARVMEYVGLGAFLTAMSIYPKIAINTPAKLMHGYDIDKQYIDDQGRKKSVMQDSNYVPYDMYLAEVPEEDIALIGDKMGIPRDIKNRNDVTKEQMRKVATQSNTLWMLTAGVTPALSALMCCGIENYVVGPAIEKTSIAKYEKAIAKTLQTTIEMGNNLEPNSLAHNKLSRNVESLLINYKGQELPKEEFENLMDLFSKDLYANTADGIKEDITKILGQSAGKGKESVVITEETIGEMIQTAKNSISQRNKKTLENVLVPTKEELENIIKKFVPADANLANGTTTTVENVTQIKQELKNLIDTKIQATTGIPKEFLISQRNDIIENISKTIKTERSSFVTEDVMKQIVDFAKVIGEFKENQAILKKGQQFNIEFANGTILANSYSKFEKTLLDQLGIKFSDLKKMRESEEFTKQILDQKFTEVCKDEVRFQKTMEKLGKVVSEMEIKLNGKSDSKSKLLDLINATENNYNNTAKRLAKLGSFETTINRLVKQDVETLGNKLTTRQELFDYLDGVVKDGLKDITGDKWWEASAENRLKYIQGNSNGVGSSKNLEISRLLERYQGAKNSFNRVIHTFDVYKRALNPESFAENLADKSPEYIETIIKKGKEALLQASAPDHTMKLDTVNNPNLYKDLMNSVWYTKDHANFNSVKQKGFVTEITENALKKHNAIENGSVLDRFQTYITRFKNIVANSTVDFTKPHHIINNQIRNEYTMAEKTRMAFFNLVGQTPVDMAKGAAGRRFATQKWVRIISGITGGVFGIALLAQLKFGKLSNPQNLQKQVNNDTSK